MISIECWPWDYKVTLADNDLPKVTIMCAEAGMQVRFPFLAAELVTFASELPSREKVQRTRLRRFFKQAMTDLLPHEVLTKTKHGFGLPFGIWVNDHSALRDCVFDLMTAIRDRRIISDAFIRSLMDHLIREEPRYYGPMVWVIIMLESWLQEHCHG